MRTPLPSPMAVGAALSASNGLLPFEMLASGKLGMPVVPVGGWAMVEIVGMVSKAFSNDVERAGTATTLAAKPQVKE